MMQFETGAAICTLVLLITLAGCGDDEKKPVASKPDSSATPRNPEKDPVPNPGEKLAPTKPADSMTLDFYLDGRSELIITPTGMYWEHYEWTRPIHLVRDGKPWEPKWNTPQLDVRCKSEPEPTPVDMTKWVAQLVSVSEQRGGTGIVDRFHFSVARAPQRYVIYLNDPHPSGSWMRLRLISPDSPDAAKQVDIEKTIVEGREAMKAHRWHDAMIHLSKACAMAPDDYRSLMERGLFYTEMHDWAKADSDLQRAITMAPDNVDVRLARHALAIAMGRSEIALGDMLHAVRIAPDHLKSRIALGRVNLSMGRADLAFAEFDIAVEKHPDNPEALLARAEGHWANRRMSESYADIEAVMDKHPNLAAAYVTRGILFQIQGRYDRANPDFAKAIELDPNDHRPYYRLAIYYASPTFENHTEVIKNADAILRLRPHDAGAFAIRGDSYLALGNTDKALADLNEAVRLGNAPISATINRAQIFNQLGKHQEALNDLNQAHAFARRNPKLHLQRGIAYLGLKDADRAIADLNLAIDLEPKLWQAYEQRSKAWELKGDAEKAKADARRAEQFRSLE